MSRTREISYRFVQSPFAFEACITGQRNHVARHFPLLQALPSWLTSLTALLLADAIHKYKAHKSCGALQWHTQVQPEPSAKSIWHNSMNKQVLGQCPQLTAAL